MNYSALLKQSSIALLVCAALVAVSYFYVDKPVAYFVSDHHLGRFVVLQWMTYVVPVLRWSAPVLVVAAVIRLAWGPLRRAETTLLAAAISLIVTGAVKDEAKFAFGRYWPTTWVENNPSLIGDGAYGFHPFHDGVIYGSFPSGHTTTVFAAMSVVWIALPRFRWLSVILCGAVVVGLIGSNYHFVGDVIAGAFLGSISGRYAARFFQLDMPPAAPPTDSRPNAVSG